MGVVRTQDLAVAYEEYGSREGPPVVLVHGFPDDARSWDVVGARLGQRGRRVLAPYVRGFGPTSFRSDDTPRSGQLGALTADLVAFLDELGLERVTLAGADWGARVTQAVAARHPDRVERLVSLGSYALSWGEGLPPYPVLQALWYQWILLLDLGPVLLETDRRGFCRALWDAWSPTWPGRGEAFDGVARSFDNPDFVTVTLSAYRHGRAECVTDPRYDDLDAELADGPSITVPSVVLLGADDGIELPSADDPRDRQHFTDLRARRILPGVGHFAHREAPEAVVTALLDE